MERRQPQKEIFAAADLIVFQTLLGAARGEWKTESGTEREWKMRGGGV